MDTIKKINEELSIAGQITIEDLKQIAEEGYQSVLNLQMPDEDGYDITEEISSQIIGLVYCNLPTKLRDINTSVISQLCQKISELPKPVLIHCDNAIRSIAVVLVYIATKQGISLDRAFQRVQKLGLLQS
jgi:uncharacterized protein (TIGR01244 family)